MNKPLFVLCLSAFWASTLAAQGPDFDHIQFILGRQVECWNKADLECFMEAYWKSDSLKFIGSEGVIYGWGRTLERYKAKYPDRQAMGELQFDILSNERIGADGFYMVGRYQLLRRDLDDLEGYFSLLWRKIDGEWKIVADHTS